MDEYFKKMMGEGPYPFPTDNIGEYIEIYGNDNLWVTKPKARISMEQGKHEHQSYEILIPLASMPYVEINKKIMHAGKESIIVINPGQAHGPGRSMSNADFISIAVDMKFMDEMSWQFFDKRGVYFGNQPSLLSHEMKNILRMYIQESKFNQSGKDYVIQSLNTLIIVQLLRQFKSNVRYSAINKTSQGRPNLDKVMEFLKECYNENIPIEEMSKLANLSTFHFIRVFKEQTGSTPYAYLMDIKIDRACEMLSTGNMTISEVSYACGFSNISHFSYVFKSKKGLSPSQYRKITR